MPEFKLKLAGRVAAVSSIFDSTPLFFHNYLTDEEADFSVSVNRADVDYERKMAYEEAIVEGFKPRNFPDTYLERLAIQRKIAENLFDYGVLLFHGSAVAVDGQCYLFTAKSGTGKSTHTRLWRQVFGDRAMMVNDDKPFLRFKDEGIFVCGSPWSGKHGLDTNTEVPLKAICLLERGTENQIFRPETSIAYFLLQQSYRPMDARKAPKYMEMVDTLASSTELWQMRCNMSPEAATVSYTAMSGGVLHQSS